MQSLGELGILFVRDQILRPQMGKKGDKWLPFLVSLFFFIWFNNIMGIIPILYFPAMSKYGYPVFLAAWSGSSTWGSASGTKAWGVTSRR